MGRTVPATHAGRTVRPSQILKVEHHLSEQAPLSHFSADASSTASPSQQAPHQPQSLRCPQTDASQVAVSLRKSSVHRQPSVHSMSSKALNDAASPSQIGVGGQGLSGSVLSHAISRLSPQRQEKASQAALTSSQQHQLSVGHYTTGHNAIDRFSKHQASDLHDNLVSSADVLAMTTVDPLMMECTQVMQLFGMNDDWFESDFLPHAKKNSTASSAL